MREDKRVEGEHKESGDLQRRPKVSSNNAKDRRKERGVHVHVHVHESDNEYGKRHGKDSTVKERDRNVERSKGKSEHATKLTQNGYEKLESRKRHERDKRRSNSPSPRGNKPRLYDIKEHEELQLSSSHSSKDKQRFDSNKRVSNNGSNNKSKRHDTSNRLGGYSPRKRRNEGVVVKTPSPTNSPLVKTEPKVPNSLTSFQPDLVSLNKIEVPKPHEVPNVVPLIVPKPNFGVLFPSIMNASVDSVQLTQATRPKRRIYVENLPSSANETSVVEWLSGYLRPFGVNNLQATSPCISCIVNKDKGQALVEFLTPEDASTALSFDGKSFSGNIVKIRRPKDYVETSTGVSDKFIAASAVSVKNIVQDSPNKVFIGGISKIITSEMLMEIVSAFGPLKAYHFEPPCAFLEYVDQSVTIKACVGLNGMKLGGQLLTVSQATPDTSSMEIHGDRPFYGTPAHAQPLLKKQTQVLKLNNVVDPQSLMSLSEQELEEILEDIRLECSRFGMVKSINIVKQPPNMSTTSETVKEERGTEPSGGDKEPVAASTGGSGEPEDGNEAAGVNGGEENSNQISCEISEPGGDDVAGAEVEGGCVLVEYKRIEASAMAAHCLHGRVFDGRIVNVEYVAHDVYCAKFGK
ncbi:hypothetical protein L1887_18620 [Cichorium endivia]|nr:hypothetical protein L1887_18620 [Cichorium endivia]